jgi:hypothetical protein
MKVDNNASIRGSIEAALATPSAQPAIVSYPNTNISRPENNSRPYFILHVGPPKTATTTLQSELGKYQQQLIKDNYVYLGQILRSEDNIFDHWHNLLLKILKDRPCQEDVNKARINRKEPPECWQLFWELLTERKYEGRNIIMSEEDLAIKYAHMDDLGRTSIDWPSLKMVLEAQGWEPIVVVGYRRLYEIMPSAKQQWDQWTPNNEGLTQWPPKGRSLQPLFPEVLKDSRLYDDYVPHYIPRTIQWSYTDHLVKTISPHLPVRLMNVHDPLSVRSTFLCRVLPYAPNACRASQMDDTEHGEVHKNTEKSLYYDAIATEAANRGWFDKDLFDRHRVGLELQEYFENERKGDPKQLPLICPNTTQLMLLLERSLIKEQQILSTEVATRTRDEHIRGFWEAASKNKFCWIDVDKALEDPHWELFLRRMVPSKSAEDSSDDSEDDDDGYYEYDDGGNDGAYYEYSDE